MSKSCLHVLDKIPSVFASDPPFVAFSVAANGTETYDQYDVIKFPHIFTDVNPGVPGWNPATNMFVCPYDGYYMFSFTLYKEPDYSNFRARLSTSCRWYWC